MESKAIIYRGKLKYADLAKKRSKQEHMYRTLMFLTLIIIWQILAKKINIQLLLPTPLETLKAFIHCLTSAEIMNNMAITLIRVLKGFMYAMVIGVPIGFIMGFSEMVEKVLSGLIDSLRQVPIMAWVPLTIIWLGIGDGPTLFMIAFAGVFPVILNTIQGVRSISKDYYNAAKSMGASPLSIFVHIIIPAALPDVLTGARIAVSSGWMSVIWAEFIATSAGLGYSMVEAQTRMQTDVLIALMFMAAFVGFAVDRVLQQMNKIFTKWRFVS